MKVILYLFFLFSVCAFCYGFFFCDKQSGTQHLYIGLGVAAFFLLWMPCFVVYRWKNKKMSDYMLNKENLKKMRDYKEKKSAS